MVQRRRSKILVLGSLLTEPRIYACQFPRRASPVSSTAGTVTSGSVRRTARPGQNQLRNLLLQFPQRQFRQLLRLPGLGRESMQNRPSTFAGDLFRYRTQFDIDRLQPPPDPIDYAVAAHMRVSSALYLPLSSTFQTDIQYTPVDSMATCLTLRSFSHCRSRSRS